MTETLCWNCNQLYLIDDPWCPHCEVTNANVDMDLAQEELAAMTGEIEP